jgi:hypothetical protein
MQPLLVALAGEVGSIFVEFEVAGLAGRETKEGFFSSNENS